MSSPYLDAFVAAAHEATQPKTRSGGDVLAVNETVSAAASFYETIRNTLEYDEEHLLRRNAIRRILKRSLSDGDPSKISHELLHELIWARYLPNNQVSVSVEGEVAAILQTYQPLFSFGGRHGRRSFHWLMDILSAQIEYHLSAPTVDDALANFAYQDVKSRLEWASAQVSSEDRDLQLYIAVHRAVLKSNAATLRYRVFTLFYPDWTRLPSTELIRTVSENLPSIIRVVESQIRHPAQDRLFRLIQRHAVVYHILRDIVTRDPAAVSFDPATLPSAVLEAASARSDRFRIKVRRSILRAIAFLLLTKTTLALAIELPYDIAVAKTTSVIPLLINILFHPCLLAAIGFTITIPEEKNTLALQSSLRSVLGLQEVERVRFVTRRAWARGGARHVFDAIYALAFVVSVGGLAAVLRVMLHFNALSIFFFLFFLSLVTFFGLKIRGSRRELVVVEGNGSFLSPLFDMFFLPIVRAGRWISLRAPRINVFLFFFDFIIEAPFKVAMKLVEGWLAFLREKREEI
jgi:hypothetical protein